MKQFASILLVISLSACGGGSGGGNDNSNDTPATESNIAPTSQCNQPTRIGESKLGASCF